MYLSPCWSAPGVAPARLSSLADAASYTGSQPYDLVFSRFGVMFFDDPVAAFRNLHSNTAASGRLVFCLLAAPEQKPLDVRLVAVAPFLPEPDSPPDPRAPGPCLCRGTTM